MADDLGNSIFNKLLKLILKTTIGRILMLTLGAAAALAVGILAQNWYFAILYGCLLALLGVLQILRRGRPAASSMNPTNDSASLGHTPLTRAIIWGIWLLVGAGFVVLPKALDKKNETWLFAVAGFFFLVFCWSLLSGRIYWGGPNGLVQRHRQPFLYLFLLAFLLMLWVGPLVLYFFFWNELRAR